MPVAAARTSIEITYARVRRATTSSTPKISAPASAAPGEDEHASRDVGAAGGDDDAPDDLAERPFLEIEHVSHGARKDRVGAREEQAEDHEERKRHREADAGGDRGPA